MQQQTNKTNTIKNKRLKSYLFFEPKKQSCFNVKFYKMIILDNNFIFAYNEYHELKQKGITLMRLIIFENCIFYTTLAPELYKNSKLII